PAVDELAKTADVAKVDFDQSPELAAEYGISAIPTTVALDEDGAEVARLNGAQPVDTLRAPVSPLLGHRDPAQPVHRGPASLGPQEAPGLLHPQSPDGARSSRALRRESLSSSPTTKALRYLLSPVGP